MIPAGLVPPSHPRPESPIPVTAKKFYLANNYNSVMIGRIMTRKHFSRRVASQLVPLIGCACLLFLASSRSAHAQTAASEQEIVVTGEEVPSAYGAPPGFSRSRFSNAVNAYVLPPWAFFFGELFEGQGLRQGGEERKRKKRADLPKFPMPTNSACCWPRILASTSNGR